MRELNRTKLPPALTKNVKLGWYVWKRYFRYNLPSLTREDMEDLRQQIYYIAVSSLQFFMLADSDKKIFKSANKQLYALCKELGLRKHKYSRRFSEKYQGGKDE